MYDTLLLVSWFLKSGVRFDVSLDKSTGVDASLCRVDINLGGNAIETTIPTESHHPIKFQSICQKNTLMVLILVLFINDGGVLRPKEESSGNKIGGYNEKPLVFVDDVSFQGNIHAADASFAHIGASNNNEPLVFVDDVSFQGNIHAADASFAHIGKQ